MKCPACKGTGDIVEIRSKSRAIFDCEECEGTGRVSKTSLPTADDGTDNARTSERSEEARSAVAGETATLSIGLVELKAHLYAKKDEARRKASAARRYKHQIQFDRAMERRDVLAELLKWLESEAPIRPMLSDQDQAQGGPKTL